MDTLTLLFSSLLLGVVSAQSDPFASSLGFDGGAGNGGGLGNGFSSLVGGLQLPSGLLGQAGGLFGQSGFLSSGGRFGSGLLGGSGMSSFVSNGANSLRQTVGSAQSGANMGLDLASNGFGMGATTAAQSLSTAIDASKQFVNTVAELKAAALSNTMDIANQALDIADQISSTIPGLGPAVGVGTTIGRQATGAIKNTGLSILGQLHTQANNKLDIVNGAAQGTTGTLVDAAHAGLTLTHNGVEMGAGTAGATVDTGEGIAHGFIGAFDSNQGSSLSGSGGASETFQTDTNLPSQATASFSNNPGTLTVGGEFN